MKYKIMFLFITIILFTVANGGGNCTKEKDTDIKCTDVSDCNNNGRFYCGGTTKVLYDRCEEGYCRIYKESDCRGDEICKEGFCKPKADNGTTFCNYIVALECEGFDTCYESTQHGTPTQEKWQLALDCAKNAKTCDESNQCWSYLLN